MMQAPDRGHQPERDRAGSRGTVLLIAAAVVVMGGCLCAGLVAGMNVMPFNWLNWPIQQGFVVALCVSFPNQPHPHIQIGWINPLMMSVYPLPPHCTLIPWLPFLPWSGSVHIP